MAEGYPPNKAFPYENFISTGALIQLKQRLMFYFRTQNEFQPNFLKPKQIVRMLRTLNWPETGINI
jgi:hypothetical protein